MISTDSFNYFFLSSFFFSRRKNSLLISHNYYLTFACGIHFTRVNGRLLTSTFRVRSTLNYSNTSTQRKKNAKGVWPLGSSRSLTFFQMWFFPLFFSVSKNFFIHILFLHFFYYSDLKSKIWTRTGEKLSKDWKDLKNIFCQK